MNDTNENGYYEGQLLVATPQIRGTCFEKSVIYLCAHNEEGAMGIIVNQVVDNIDPKDIFKQFGIDLESRDIKYPIHFGGPVDTLRGFILHSADYSCKGTLVTADGYCLSSSTQILEDLVNDKGPRDALLALGYAGWGAQQIEAEVEANSWFTVPATREIVFGRDNKTKWLKAAEMVGVDPFMLSDSAGHA